MTEIEATIRALLKEALAACPKGTDGDTLRAEIVGAQQALEKPLNVAVIGLAKAGKSTIMNALLQRDLVATDDSICTSKVTCFRYAERELVRYHCLDGTVRTAPLEDLHKATRRGGDEELQRNLRFVEVLVANPALKFFDLIDTPGGESHYISDSEETRAFLERHGYEAIVYIFRQGVHHKSAELIASFRGAAFHRSTPLNSMGVLSCVDRYWKQGSEVHPLEAAMPVVERLRSESAIQELFFRIFPACGLLAVAAYTLDESMLLALKALAALPEDRLVNLLSNAKRFVKQFPSEIMPAGAAAASILLDKLDLYGIWVATDFVKRSQLDCSSLSTELLAAELLRRSGIGELESALKQHFGTRVFLIKWNSVRPKLQKVAFRVREQGSVACQSAARMILLRLEEAEGEEYLVQELNVLRDLYEGRLEISPEEQLGIRAALGESGSEHHERLGFSEPVGQDQLLERARSLLAHWQKRCVDPKPKNTGTRVAEATMVRSLERLEVHLRSTGI